MVLSSPLDYKLMDIKDSALDIIVFHSASRIVIKCWLSDKF